jgi:PST family polysaccharide transporter
MGTVMQVRAASSAAPEHMEREVRRESWGSLLAAMSKSGGASVLSSLLSALASKILAVTAGPAGLALLATLQQTRQAALVAATGNGQTALIQGASALKGHRRREYLRTAAWVFLAAGMGVVLAMTAAPRSIAALAGLPAGTEALIRWLAIPVGLLSILVFLSALLNAIEGIGRLGIVQVAASLAMAAGAWPAAYWLTQGRARWLVYLLSFSAAASVAVAAALLARDAERVRDWFRGPGRLWTWSAARHFFSISAAMLLSGLTGSVALLVVRGRITASQGLAVTGQFDAAWAISMNHATMVLSSLQIYFLPALARTVREGKDQADGGAAERSAQISRVLTIAALAATVAIAGIALTKSRVLALLYSDEFRPAADYLRWTLAGDYLKVSGWVLSIPILAAADMKAFLISDLASYGVFLAAAMGLTRWISEAESAGAAFVMMHAAHVAICAMYLQTRYRFRPSRLASAAWLAGLATVAGVSLLTWNRA